MGLSANFEIVKCDSRELIIKDVGPWDRHLSVTNDVENVVLKMVYLGHMAPGKRFFYYDSEGVLDEILVNDQGDFAGFLKGGR